MSRIKSRIPIPQFDESILVKGEPVDEIYTVYGYDEIEEVFLVGNTDESCIREVKREDIHPLGGIRWTEVKVIWREGDEPTAYEVVEAWLNG